MHEKGGAGRAQWLLRVRPCKISCAFGGQAARTERRLETTMRHDLRS
jgi:hypothetical protein